MKFKKENCNWFVYCQIAYLHTFFLYSYDKNQRRKGEESMYLFHVIFVLFINCNQIVIA